MKKRILACLLALVMLIGAMPVMALAEDNVVTPEDFAEAVKNAKDGDTITLGKGTFTLYGEKEIAKGKSLTFVGAGKDETIWNIGPEVPNPAYIGTEYNGDYSFDGAKSVTFKNLRSCPRKKTILVLSASITQLLKTARSLAELFIGATRPRSLKMSFLMARKRGIIRFGPIPVMKQLSRGCTFNVTDGRVVNVPASGDGRRI